jgi:hypothetical protein
MNWLMDGRIATSLQKVSYETWSSGIAERCASEFFKLSGHLSK